MRVFQINTVPTGSTGSIAQNICDGIREYGWECVVAYGRGKSANENFYKFTSDKSVYYHALKSRITDKSGFYSKRDTKKLIRKIEEYAPDVIHLHNLHGYYINVELLFNFLKSYNKPVVWTLHDCWSFTGHCVHFGLAGCMRWQTGCYGCPNKTYYPKSIFRDNSKNNYELKKQLFANNDFLTIVPVSHWLSDLCDKSFFKGTKKQVIHNGINTDIFKYTRTDLPSELRDKKIVLGVANVWDSRKGLYDFYELAQLLPNGYKVVLVGLSKKQMRELPKNIYGITRTKDAAELSGLYSAAEVFVNMTYEDNLPTVNIEAAACRTPVITYNTGGCAECVYGGTVVDTGDVLSVKNAIVSGDFNNPNVNTDMLDRKRMSEQYIKLYTELTAPVTVTK